MGVHKNRFRTLQTRGTVKNEGKLDAGDKGKNQSIWLYHDLKKNLSHIRADLGNSGDLSVHLARSEKSQCAILFMKQATDTVVLTNISREIAGLLKQNKLAWEFFIALQNSVLGGMDSFTGNGYETLYDYLLSGYAIVLIDQCNHFLAVNVQHTEGRTVSEPTSQTVVRGPKEGFTEKNIINIALIRKRIKNIDLRVENCTLGSVTKTNISLVYIHNIAKNEIVEEVKERLSKIKCNAIFEGGNVEEWIKDDPYSIFPTFLNSEKPDSVAANLLEGKVAVLVDGTPYVLTAPAVFAEFFQASEDYYHSFWTSSMIRVLRYITFFLALLIPALYIALTSFNHEMIPTSLLTSIAAQKEGVPFPTFVEIIIMIIVFEVIREAGIRMPRVIGPAISIVGALVLGQAAVEAGIISSAIVIVVSITSISNFAIANYSMGNALMISRFAFIALAELFGLYGVFMGVIVLILHLCKLKSIGIPYMTPMAPKLSHANSDTYVRPPIWDMRFPPVFSKKSEEPRNANKPVGSGVRKDQEFR